MNSGKLKRWMPLVFAAMLGAGCGDDPVNPGDLAPPLGLTSITGDGQVVLSWYASNYGEDRDGFHIFQAVGSLSGTPDEIPVDFGTQPVASLESAEEAGHFTKTVTGLTNGTTYSFLVVAFDDDRLSRPGNVIGDTPRSESDGSLTLVNGGNNLRYLDVNTQTIQTGEDLPRSSDVLCESFNAGAGVRAGMVGVNGARIQDLGYVSNWDDIDNAPTGVDSYPAAGYSVQVLAGHVYAVFTGDNHYAKVYVTGLNPGNFGYTVRVAYQPQAGNNELKPGGPGR
ncbi:MAG: hypothetical protein SGI90_13810 [Candidatus Eisenbacteria bacterium]|nr:hypothetical protein [Candidatus Eisenbacteria bacterium]